MAAPSEQILLRTHPSRLFTLGYYIVALLLLLAALGLSVNSVVRALPIPGIQLGPLTFELWLAALGGVLGLLLVLAAEIRRITTTYTVTDSRILRREGILNLRTNAIPYRQVERVELEQNLFQRIVRVGTVRVDTGEESLLIEQVKKPDGVERVISQRISLFR